MIKTTFQFSENKTKQSESNFNTYYVHIYNGEHVVFIMGGFSGLSISSMGKVLLYLRQNGYSLSF